MSIPHFLFSDLMKTAFMTALCRQYGKKTLEAADDIVVEPNPDRKKRYICSSQSALVVGKISIVGSRLAVSLFTLSRKKPGKAVRIVTYRFDDTDIPALSMHLATIRVLGTLTGILFFPFEMTVRATELFDDVIALSCMVPDVATDTASLVVDTLFSGIPIPEPLDGILSSAAESLSGLSEAFVPEWIRNAVAEAFEPLLAASGLDRIVAL
ncbi:MAG: hypothetical protein HGA38_02255 [Candidatus Moranbacteria bacterium]|nr:hypothetical protein [Candidatus Moranbacteria bacterium]NTW45716.1 hypothetical protein [Candidatus Moranbacteria bacterium]